MWEGPGAVSNSRYPRAKPEIAPQPHNKCRAVSPLYRLYRRAAPASSEASAGGRRESERARTRRACLSDTPRQQRRCGRGESNDAEAKRARSCAHISDEASCLPPSDDLSRRRACPQAATKSMTRRHSLSATATAWHAAGRHRRRHEHRRLRPRQRRAIAGDEQTRCRTTRSAARREAPAKRRRTAKRHSAGASSAASASARHSAASFRLQEKHGGANGVTPTDRRRHSRT